MARFHEYFGGLLYWTVQNMNKGWDKPGGATGALWKKGRARLWVRLTKAQRAGRQPGWSFGISWSFGGRDCRAMLSIGDWGDDTDIGLGLAIPGIALWFDIEDILPSRWRPRDGRDLGFFVGGGSIFVKLWSSQHDWYKSKPFSHPSSSTRQPVLHITDWLLGRTRHTARDLDLHRTTITLPEGIYPVRVRFTEHTWKRPRWRPHAVVRASVQVLAESGIPIPGKGENGYDADEDAIYSLTTPAQTVEQALAALQSSVNRDRERHGGSNWLPAQPGVH